MKSGPPVLSLVRAPIGRILAVAIAPTPLHQPVPAPLQPRRTPLRIVIPPLLLAVYLLGAVHQGFRVNVDMRRTDQSAYMEYARRMATSDYAYVGGRDRMPIYPFLQSLLYRPGLSDEEFFRRGKIFNIALSVVLLLLTYLLLRKWIEPLAAGAIVLVSAFTVFMFKAGHFQCELLFYFLNLLLFVLCIENLLRPTALRAGVLGLVAGLAYLTKASVLPALVLFALCYTSAHIVRRDSESGGRLGSEPRAVLRVLVVGLVFLLVVAPYIRTSKRVFGRYFYNVTSTFYLWYDSWEEVERGTKAHGDRIGWPDMPSSKVPSVCKYWREHSFAQIAQRLANGAGTVLSVAWASYGYLKYAAVYALSGLLYVLHHRKRVAEALSDRAARAASAFVILYFAGYFLLYSWYAPIADGNRLTLSLFLPGLSAIGYVLSRIGRQLPVRVAGVRLTPAGIHRFALAVLSLDLVFWLPWAITHMSGAD